MFELTESCSQIVIAINQILAHHSPILVALDGGSGAGKSTLASMLLHQVDSVIVPLDDFYSANIPDWEWDARSTSERIRDVFDMCAEIRAAYLGQINSFITLVTNRIQTFGVVPPNGLAWTGVPPVHPEGAGTGVTLVSPNWDARNLDQCGDPTGLSWRDVNIQPAQQSPFAIKLDQYFGGGQVGFTLSFAVVCNGGLKVRTVNVQGSEIWRERQEW